MRKELQREIVLVRKIFTESIELLDDYKEWKRQNVRYVELIVDVLRREIVNFLRKISCAELSSGLSQKLFTYTAMANDIERIGNLRSSLPNWRATSITPMSALRRWAKESSKKSKRRHQEIFVMQCL